MPEIVKGIEKLSIYTQALRYKNLKSDPTAEEAYAIFEKTKNIIAEICSDPRCEAFMNEALEVHNKMIVAAEKIKAEHFSTDKISRTVEP